MAIMIENTKQVDKECVNKMLVLAKTGVPYTEIAERMTKQGYRAQEGGEVSVAMVSYHLIQAGFRKHQPAKRSYSRRPHKKTAQDQAAPNTKWELLSSIERCQDLTAPSKKALLDLVFRELNK